MSGKKITRRDFSKGVAASAAGMTFVSACDMDNAQEIASSLKHKNVLIIMMDQGTGLEVYNTLLQILVIGF